MKTKKTLRTTLVSLAVLALGAAAAFSASARLRYQERQLLENAVGEVTFGDTLADVLDEPYSFTFTYRGLTASSNDVLAIQAKDLTQLHPNWSDTSTAVSRGGTICYISSDAKGYAPATALALAQGTNGNYIPIVANEMFMALFNSAGKFSLKIAATHAAAKYVRCHLPNEKWQVAASHTF